MSGEGRRPRQIVGQVGVGKHSFVDVILPAASSWNDFGNREATRFLHQHAPGSGKTEIIALLTLELLRRGTFGLGRLHGGRRARVIARLVRALRS